MTVSVNLSPRDQQSVVVEGDHQQVWSKGMTA